MLDQHSPGISGRFNLDATYCCEAVPVGSQEETVDSAPIAVADRVANASTQSRCRQICKGSR
ncbi:hypothetical protein BN12_530033 [Nostocoides japonicum T1-X7]|uniref:Uncharacterized protein n=1 Tax=Nostocoides japonicum T1-X7 TaxID=1194083 RepID=A0A077M6D4_9MICO|nr:hypothetical protein BN12_530033 [Tetrasphaera japonica T1-X7]